MKSTRANSFPSHATQSRRCCSITFARNASVLLFLLCFASPTAYGEDTESDIESSKPFEMRVGPFDFHPRLRTAATYDDNILFAANETSDIIYTVEPRIVVFGGDRLSLFSFYDQDANVLTINPDGLIIQPSDFWPGKMLALDYAPRWQFYSDHDNNDSLDHLLNFNAVLPITKLIVGVHQTLTLEKVAIVEAGSRSKMDRINSELSAAHQFSEKTSANLRLTRSSVDYPDDTNLVGYVEWAANASVNYQLTPAINLALTASGGFDEVNSGLDQRFAQAGGRLRFYYSDLLSFDAAFSGEYREFETANEDTFAPVFSLGIQYRPWARTSFSLTGARRQYASIFNGNYYVSTGGNVTVSQGVTDRISTSLDLGYYYTEYKAVGGTTAPPSTDYYSARLTVNVKLWRHLDGRTFYQFRGRGLAVDDEIENNQAGFEMVLSY